MMDQNTCVIVVIPVKAGQENNLVTEVHKYSSIVTILSRLHFKRFIICLIVPHPFLYIATFSTIIETKKWYI